MSWLRTDRGSVTIRRRIVLDTLAERPWSTARMLTDAILDETGGAPALATGALWVPPWTVYSDLQHHERAGRVERRQFSKRSILWRAVV